MSPADGEVMENSSRGFHDFHSLDINMEEDEHEQEAEPGAGPGAELGVEQVHRQQVSWSDSMVPGLRPR